MHDWTQVIFRRDLTLRASDNKVLFVFVEGGSCPEKGNENKGQVEGFERGDFRIRNSHRCCDRETKPLPLRVRRKTLLSIRSSRRPRRNWRLSPRKQRRPREKGKGRRRRNCRVNHGGYGAACL